MDHTLAEQGSPVYLALREGILTGALQPMERMSENQLAAQLGVSRTPVREALRRLEAERLVLVVPKRGSFVSQPTVQDVLELYQIRTPLECLAARIAAETIETDELSRLESLVEAELDEHKRVPERSLAASREFHAILFACSRNKRLSNLLTDLQHQVHRVRMLWPARAAVFGQTWSEHAGILHALRTHNADGAEQLMREHMERARARIVSRLAPGLEGLSH